MDGKRKAEKASKISVVSKKSKTSRDGNEGPSSHNVESDGDEGPSLHNIESVEFVEDASASTDKLPRLSIRTSPLVLIKSIAKMNEAQKNSVNSMGFGDLLKMKVTKIPGKLGYWVLKSFDEDACELVINDGQRRIHIDEHDVWLTLGLPKGRTRIRRKTKSQYPDIVEAWKSYFEDHDPEKISPTLVSKRMIAEIDGGTWFKRLFLMLMATCLIEGSSNSYVQPKLLINFEDLTTVKDLNWCNYVIKVLIEQKGNWAKNTNNHFLGPISFLVTFYADRVIVGLRKVPRKFPTIQSWSSKLLKERESLEISKGCFGLGYPCKRYSPPKELTDKISENIMSGANTDKPSTSATGGDVTLHSHTDLVLKAASKMTNSMIEFITLLKETPDIMLKNPTFKRIMDSTHNLLGSTIDITPTAPATQQSTQELECIFWEDPARLAVLDEMAKTKIERDQLLKSMCEPPSFSIGLTQMDINDDLGLDKLDVNTLFNDQVDRNANPTPIDTQDEVVNANPMPTNEAGKNANPTPIDTRDEVNEAEKNANPTPNDADDNHLDAPRNEELRTKNRLDRGKTKVTTETVLKRSTREQKKPDTLLSPYVVRVIDITDKLNKVEKDVYLWTFHNKEANSMEELYSDGNFTLFRNDIVTLAPRLHVSTSVVDVWCSILNNQEGSRSADSPYRFFATTLPCLKTIVDAPTDLSNNELQANFNYTLNLVLQKVGGVDLSKVDLIFFPIIRYEHFFLICMNIMRNKVEIIDNSDVLDNKPIVLKYGVVPNRLRNYFINFLSSNGLDAKASLLKNSQMKVLQMPWRDNKNKDDCGVYVMRHMETYMGESQNRWNSGLRKGWKKPLAHLRVKYTKVILLSDQNIHKDKIKSASELHFTDSNEKGEINVEELVMNTTYSF